MKETERMKIDDPSQPEVASALLMILGERVEMQPGSPNIIMPTPKAPECSMTTGLVGDKAPTTRASLIQVSSSSSEEGVDYSGEDHDFSNEQAPHPDTSKFSHMTEEETQVAASRMELPLGYTTTTDGIVSTPIIAFLFHHKNLVLILACMTFTEAAVTTEGETSSNITEKIEELTQLECLEVPKTSTGAIPLGTACVAGKSSQSGDLPEDLPSLIPQPGKIQ